VKSPYLWSFSNHYLKGKYVADGKWDPNAVSQQAGAMVILRRLAGAGEIRLMQPPPVPVVVERVPRRPSDEEDVHNPSGMSPGSDELDADSVAPESDFDPLARTYEEPKAVPPGNRVQFATSSKPAAERHWPVLTRSPNRLIVSYETVSGGKLGRPGRRFLAEREGGARFHVGIDLFANHHDEVRACEDGRVTAFYKFYTSGAGEATFCLLIEHDDFVINYGEVKESAPSEYGWRVGSHVRAGQKIARVSSTGMLHFEAYVLGTTRNERWYPSRPRPSSLLNPTRYLLEIAYA